MEKQTRNPAVLVIGAGMSGILLGIKLREAGITDITIVEKGDGVGGTWRENTYPGVSCDVPAHMYAYSFEPFVGWDDRFAEGAQIRQYFEQTADKYGITELVRFNEEVTAAQYRDGRWQVTTSKGDALSVDFIVAATGILHHPSVPDIPGLSDFAGPAFHTARWDHKLDFSGKRVGVIGTGSTAAQVIPALVNQGVPVSIFQRTPQWMFPRPDAHYSPLYKKTLARFPFLATLIGRLWAWYYAQMFAKMVIGKPLQFWITDRIVRRNLEKAVADPELRAKLTPDYRVGCKRLVLASDFFEAVQQPHCELITDDIDHVEPDGIVTRDGNKHPLDVLVLATGFHHLNFMRPMDLTGRDGIHIETAWQQQCLNYRSVTIPGFPNFFLMTGPNSPVGNFSVTRVAEVQADYMMKLIRRWQQGEFDAIEPRPDAADSFLSRIKANMAGTVWTGGCQSWYLDPTGTPALWPFTFGQWVEEMREPNLADFDVYRSTSVSVNS